MSSLVEITVPSDQREGTESVVGRWLKAVGDPVQENEPLLEINTDKVTLEVASPATGVLREITKNSTEKIDLSEVLGKIEVGAVAHPKQGEQKAQAAKVPTARDTNGDAAQQDLSPAVKKAVKDHKLDLKLIKGSGAGARITMLDIEAHLAKRGPASSTLAATKSSESRKVPHSPMRKNIAHHMLQSVMTAPHVTTVFDADLTRVIADRERQRDSFNARGVKLTLTAYFVQAVVAALNEVPEVNSRWSDSALEIVGDFNIGIAAAVENAQGAGAGLVVPVLRRAQDKDLFQIASELQQLTERARSGKLTAADLKDGTFTISNHGVSGSLFAAPIIINQPQSAILGIGKLEKRAVVRELGGRDSLLFIPSVYVTLTIDHRALDGYLANKFLSKFVNTLESC